MAVIFDGTNTKYGTLPNFSYFHRTKNATFALWFKPAGGVTQQFMAGEDQNAGGSTRYTGFTYRGNSSGQVSLVRASVETHHDLGTPALNAWNFVLFSRPNSGVAVATPSALNSTDSSPSTLINQDFELVRLILGARRIAGGSTYTDLFNGKVGAWSVWDRVLTSGEIDSLQAGAHPNTIASGLVDYDVINGTGTATTRLTNAGTTMTFVGSPSLDNDTPFPTAIVVDVNGDDIVSSGSTGNIIQTDGFTTTPDTVTIDGYAATSIVWNGGTEQVTFNFPTYVDGVTHPEPDTNHELICASGSETDSITIHLDPIDLHDAVAISSAVDDDNTYIGYHYTLNDTDKLVFPHEDGDFTVTNDGGVTATNPGVRVIWHWNNSTEVMTQLNVNVNEAGVVSVTTGKIKLGIGLGIGI